MGVLLQLRGVESGLIVMPDFEKIVSIVQYAGGYLHVATTRCVYKVWDSPGGERRVLKIFDLSDVEE